MGPHFLTRSTSLLAPLRQDPARADWLARKVNEWRRTTVTPTDYASRLQDVVADKRKTPGFCAVHDVTWGTLSDPCWLCEPTAVLFPEEVKP